MTPSQIGSTPSPAGLHGVKQERPGQSGSIEMVKNVAIAADDRRMKEAVLF
jgi:hypothetical protein